jgi:PEP-CTERM motif
MAKRLVLLFFVLALTVAASATKIQVSEPICNPATDPNTIGPAALQNGFNAIGPINGGGSFTFCNGTGESWTNLIIAIKTDPSITPADVTCPSFDPGHDPNNTAQLAFIACQVKSPSPGNLDVLLFGTINVPGFPIFPGVPDSHSFTIDFSCPNGACAGPPLWPEGTVSRGFPDFKSDQLPTVPEPASLVLLGSGVLAVIARRKR